MQASVGNKTISVEVMRPSWNDLDKSYKFLYNIGKNGSNQARLRYEHIGGQALEEYNRNSDLYENTCGLLVSYALNYSGFPITQSEIKNISGTKLKDKNNRIYLTGAREVQQLLQNKFKKLDWRNYPKERKDFVKTFYNIKDVKIIDYRKSYYSIDISNPENEKKYNIIKENNKAFFDELKKFNTTGIICMTVDGWDNAYVHTTLWHKDNFIDLSNYLTDDRIFLVREIYFWYIK